MRSVVGNVAGLALVFASLAAGMRWLSTGRPPRVLRPVVDRAEAFVAARRPRREPIPPVLLALELGRLANHIRWVEASDMPNKAERLMAARLAYDHALRDYCRAVDIPVPPAIRGLSREQRFHMESALIGAGHEW
ncbi:hypothetical protein RKE38_13250 [Phycicoccus sp. M110.8]|uniref:hypothetical protein n=1 Tax=Phycicoccus sp. M110.8 TaxID=3075433 RepID=UPI0028FD4927|nr:hypothetical protein [Phycicoccus sp. M110.8]MDU0314659.1 hypothetical protein [Phycicoccus sp. M110.8]HET8767363.1 hypothetical protein [Pedococcus sp.]